MAKRKKPKQERREIHVVPCKLAKRWLVVSPNRKIAQDLSPKSGVIVACIKKFAVEIGRKFAQYWKCELIVHNAAGKVAYRNSYGNDPKNRKG